MAKRIRIEREGLDAVGGSQLINSAAGQEKGKNCVKVLGLKPSH
jgi:hypothetical protein